jgi:hypothetical protein
MKGDIMQTRCSLFLLSVVFLAVLFSSNVCLAGSKRLFQSEANGYSIAIPDGWVKIPDEILAERFKFLFSTGSKAVYSFEMAYQQSSSGQWFEYPYVLVQVMTYSKMGLNRQIYKSEFKKIISGLTGLDMDDVINEHISDDAKGFVSGGAIGEVSLDQENNLYVVGLEMNVDGVGRIQGQGAGHFGQYSIIQVNFYDLKSNWNLTTAERELIQESFKFDPSVAYNEDAQKPAGFIGRVLPFVVLVLILVGISFAWRYVKIRMSYKKNNNIYNGQNE